MIDGTRVGLWTVAFAALASGAVAADPVSRPLPKREVARPATPLFEAVSPATSGVTFVNPIDIRHPMKRLYHSGYLCGGVVMADFDGDARVDLFFASGPRKNALYLQRAPWRFEDIAATAGVDGGEGWDTGAQAVDLDGDGNLDLDVCQYEAPNRLYLNDGRGRFREAAREWGLDVNDACLLPSFMDYDLDGDLDLFLLTNRFYRAEGRPKEPPFELQNGKTVVKPAYEKYYGLRQIGPTEYTMDEVGRPDRLLRNDGRRFVDVTAAAGLGGTFGHGLSATWVDYNTDGRPDLFIGNDFVESDRLWRNNGDGTFTDVAPQTMNHTSWYSMGAEEGDINNDGLFDLLVLDMAGTTHYKQKASMGQMGKLKFWMEQSIPRQMMRNVLHLSTGLATFTQIEYLAGLAKTDWSWAPKLADYDEDGWLDVFVSNGMSRDFNNSDIPFSEQDLIGKTEWEHFEQSPPKPEKNLAFRNTGRLGFEEVSAAWGLDLLSMSLSAATGDIDGDGDVDLVVANLDAPASLYRNTTSRGHRVILRLEGREGNRQALGSVARIETWAGTQVRRLNPNQGFLSCNVPEFHFGLGSESRVRKLVLTWGRGAVQEWTDLEADRLYVLTEPEMTAAALPTARTEPMFVASPTFKGPGHRDLPYDDFQHQSLLPNKYSQLGPGMAWGDVDGDGDDDLYIAGGAGTPRTLWLNEGGRGFSPRTEAAFNANATAEEMAPVFFDADGDRDLDLYVSSGSNEMPVGDARLNDRLYLNDGHGHFSRAPDGTLPEDKTCAHGAVAAADFDRDGDVDLFVAGRLVPRNWPTMPQSRLLRNEGGRFVEVTPPALRNTGMVTSALWSDVEGDGWVDLLVAHEWGPVKLFHNAQGTLTDATAAAGLAELTGWWNSLCAFDADGDGDMDYAAGNVGLNTKYHASPRHPALLFYGDYEGDGTRQIVEAEYEQETLFPVRGRSCSSRAMPHLKDKFRTFDAFAKASLPQIYTQEKLEQSQRLAATTLQSGVFRNDGKGRFSFEPMPRLAQASPIFGLAAADVDADGDTDLYAVQNFYPVQMETGRYDTGVSLLLENDGHGALLPVWPHRSGLFVPGDGRAAAPVDLNHDGWADLVATQNNASAQAFIRQGATTGVPVVVRVPGWRSGVIRVNAEFSDGTSRVGEISAGGGYLTQGPPALFFGAKHGLKLKSVRLTSGDGRITTHTPREGERTMLITGE
jgi:predicted nucleotidyltransferase